MPNRIDLTGKRFGRLTVIEYAGKSKWLCKCDCGTVKAMSGEGLRKKGVQSCGCLCKERHPVKHGDSYTRLYKRYKGMLSRCNNPNNVGWKNYGGRGIYVCEEWANDYETFKSWALTNGYSPELTIDRIDNDGPYSPDNCRFVTKKEQACNRRDSRPISIGGVEKVAKDWVAESTVSYDGILSRLERGWSPEEAVFHAPQNPGRDPKTGRFVKVAI